MKSKLEIILETEVAYPNNRARATVGQGCAYATIDGKNCAVGRCMENPDKVENISLHKVSISKELYVTLGLFRKRIPFETLLKKEYQGHEFGFWTALQFFHDTHDHFQSNGLTERGKKYLENLKSEYAASN